ncbi:pyridoxal phosphate-dependent aminotransferase [Candidatus Vidania fulgoroideorum]
MLIDLSIGEKRKKNHLIKFKKSDLKSFYKYPKKNNKLFLSIKNWVKKRYKKNINYNHLIITTGNREALFSVSYSIKNKKKYILLPKPYYHIYIKIAKEENKKIIFYDHKNLLKILEKKKILKKINYMIVNSPNNFDGFFFNKKTIKKISNKAKKNDFFVISDECYSEIYYKKKPISFFDIKKNKRVIILNSLSKRSHSPGLRSGFIYTTHEKKKKKIESFKKIAGSCTSNFIQKKSIALWNDEKHVNKIRNFYKKNVDKCVKIIKKCKKKIKKPKSGFYICIKKSPKKRKKKIDLIKKKNVKIKIADGSLFGKNEYIRIALVEKFSICKKSIKIILKKCC